MRDGNSRVKQGKSGLIRLRDPFPSLQGPMFVLPSKVKPFYFQFLSFSVGFPPVYPNTLSFLRNVPVEMLLLLIYPV